MRIKNLFFTAMLSILSVFAYAQTAETFRQPYPLGDKLSPNPNFMGEVWLASLSEQKELNVPMVNVTFEPGCRNSWYSHKAGQLLIATAGIGYYQEKGQPARRLFPGDIVEIAPKAGYAIFAPTIERFLKEHLFADIFERDLLTYRERELATVSILAGVGGVEPMFKSHAAICLHLGLTDKQLSALLNIVEVNIGKTYSEPLRGVLNQLTEKK